MNTVFKPFPLLRTERLVLRELKQTDVDDVFFLRTNAEVLKYLDRPPATLKVEAAAYIEMIRDQVANENAILWGISLEPVETLIGTICLWHLEKENFRAETGYVLHPDFHRQGIMKEALTAVVNFGFEYMKLHTITANVNPDNESSIRLLKSLGFEQEAYFRENFYFGGNFLDTVIFTKISPQK